MSTKTTHFVTTGMHCGSCSMLIELTIKKESGVESVKADYAKGTTDVVYDSDVITADMIAAKIADLGYTAVAAS